MYNIEKKEWGFYLIFSGYMLIKEMHEWYDASKIELETCDRPFGVIVDMRDIRPLLPDAQVMMLEGQRLYREKGMFRSAVILENTFITMQFKRIARESHIYSIERYLDASRLPNAANLAEDWVIKGIDPDLL